MTHTISVINQKGGVGKTTTAINVASYLQKLGKSVLIVDLDPQGNATSGVGLDKKSGNTAYEVIMGSVKLSDAIIEIDRLGISIVPANETLAAAEIDLAGEEHREHKLKKAFTGVAYDFVIIDCPPALSLLTINALTASNWVLIPVQVEYYALEGLSQLLAVLQRVRQGLNPDVELLGVVATMYDARTSLSEQVYNELKKHFDGKLFSTVVPRNVRLAEAPSHGRTIHEHDKWSKGARSYKQLAKEIEKRVGERY